MSSTTLAPGKAQGAVDRYFHITERGSTIGREIRGGLVTFFAMCYIIVLNPIILSNTAAGDGKFLGGGTHAGGATAAAVATTALVAGVMSIAMGVVAKFPLALAAGLGVNSMVVFSIAVLPGMSFPDAMGLVVIAGLLIFVLVLTGFRKAIFRAVPGELKTAIGVGIGLFIALIGLVDAGVVRATGQPSPPVQFGRGTSIGLSGWPILVFVVGLLLAIVLMVKKVKGAILISIVTSTVLAVVIEAIAHVGPRSVGGKVVNDDGWGLNVPEFRGVFAAPDFSLIGHFSLFGSISKIGPIAVVLLVFSLLLADFFDTMGTMVAIGAEAGLLDEEGNPPSTQQILIVDSLACVAGGAASISSNTAYVESAAGVGDGARTGLAAVTTGVCFLLSTFLAPIVEMVPYEAATPALVVVGFLMMMAVSGIEWKNLEIAIPAFLTIVMMPFTYSITVGIGAGFVSYVVIKLFLGKARQIHPLMWVAFALFIVYFTMGPIQQLLGIAH